MDSLAILDLFSRPHEEQHQELLFTDLKYNLGHNPLYPPYFKTQLEQSVKAEKANPLGFISFSGGNFEIGHAPPTVENFVFDNESPRHKVYVGDFSMADRLITNGEYLEFIEAGASHVIVTSYLFENDEFSFFSSTSYDKTDEYE